MPTVVRIPEVPAGATVKGTGRIIGPGGPYADRVYVNRWYLIGPFERKHDQAWSNEPDPPEQAVVLDAAYRGEDGRLLEWEYVDSASYPLIPPLPAEEAVYYGYTDNTHGRDDNFSEGKRVVHFGQGRNKLFFKRSNGLGPVFFPLVLTT